MGYLATSDAPTAATDHPNEKQVTTLSVSVTFKVLQLGSVALFYIGPILHISGFVYSLINLVAGGKPTNMVVLIPL